MDVAEPDERSLITYVSSLYDVFPEVPPLAPYLSDNVRILLSTCHYFSLGTFVRLTLTNVVLFFRNMSVNAQSITSWRASG